MYCDAIFVRKDMQMVNVYEKDTPYEEIFCGKRITTYMSFDHNLITTYMSFDILMLKHHNLITPSNDDFTK